MQKRWLSVPFLAVALAFGLCGMSSAQTPEALRAEYDAAFQQTLQKPSDPPTLVKFAELAVQVGDIEGAISALERLLLLDADQPEVKLELGVLYFRIGSVEAARTYLNAALSSPQATSDTKKRAEEFLKAAR
jgi:Flp pilus assembly protein TadD